MRLHSYRIMGFRSIVDTGDCKLSDVDNIVVLAGQNEAGKTAVLEALDYFKNGPSDSFVKFQRRVGVQRTEVICTFQLEALDLKHDEISLNHDQLARFIKTNQTLSFTRLTVDTTTENIRLTKESTELLRLLMPEIKQPESPAGESKADQTEDVLPSEETGTPEKSTAQEPAPGKPDNETTQASNGDSDPKQEEKPLPEPAPADPAEIAEVNFKSFCQNVIDSIPTFSFYATFSDLLPSERLVSELKSSSAILDFEKVFDVNLEDYSKIADPRDLRIQIERLEKVATDDFNESWTQSIASVEGEEKYQFSIQINNADPKSIIFMIKGKDGTPLYIEQKSAGFRWFSAFHLRLRSLMGEETLESESEKNHSRFILLIDEPGQNLHDIAQQDVKKILEETSTNNIQIIYSTHNPHLIGTEGKEFTRIRLVSNSQEYGTQVQTIPQFISREKGGSIDALSPIRTAMGLTNIHSIVDSDKFNIVVEGITDHYYLSGISKALGKDNRIRFIPSTGVDNIKHVVSVLIGWGYNYKAVFDDDANQGRKAFNLLKRLFFEDDEKLAHDHMLKIKGCDGIEDVFSVTDFESMVLGRKRTEREKDMLNSAIVKKSGKEMYARLFLERVENGEKLTFTKESLKSIDPVFEWIYSKYGISN